MKITFLAGSALFLALVLTGQGCPSKPPDPTPAPVVEEVPVRRVKIGPDGTVSPSDPIPAPAAQPAPGDQD